MWKLQKGEYIEMWYFTNASLAAASKTALAHTGNESLIPVSDSAIGLLTFIPMVAKQ